MIEIIADLDRLVPVTDGVVISAVAEYVPAYKQILQAYTQDQNLTVTVQHATVEHWLKQMSSRYPKGSFTFKRIDARLRLADLWQISIPASVEPDEIVTAGLLELELTPRQGDSFENVILEHFYDPIFASREFPFSRLVELVLSYTPPRWSQNDQIRLVRRIYLERLTQWRKKAKSSEQKRLVELFSADIEALQLQLMAYKILRTYKKLGHKLLGDNFILFEALKLNLISLNINEEKISNIVTQVTYVLNGYVSPTTVAEAETLISSLSGLLMVEFDFIEQKLTKSPDLIVPRIIAALEVKFETLQSRIGRRLARLKSLIRPEKPTSPDTTWSVDQMLDWATQKYLPYQTWCNKNDIVDTDLYALADEFAQWLYKNWHDVRLNSKKMVFNILPNHTGEFKQADRVNLILVVDNLGWGFASEIRTLFQEQSFFISKAEPYLAMLPSETEFSKKCLLAGAPTYNDIDIKDYTAIIEKGWVPYFNEASFRYISDIGKLNKVTEITKQTYVVNYLAVDKALHKSSDELGIPHTEHIRHLLKWLVEAVIDFIKKHGLEQKIVIHVCSDHGSIRIPKDVPNDLTSDSYKSSDFPEVSHRYTTVSNAHFNKLPDNLRQDCFFLRAEEFGNSQHVLCARRANRFKATDDTFYVHGGLSPEEVVVPYLTFEMVKAPVQDLTVLLSHNEFRYRQEIVALEVGNPNKYAIENVQIDILNSNMEAEPIKIDWLNPESKLSLQLPALFKQTPNPDERTSLSYHVRFVCHSEQHTQNIKLPIVMRSMVEVKDESIFDLLG